MSWIAPLGLSLELEWPNGLRQRIVLHAVPTNGETTLISRFYFRNDSEEQVPAQEKETSRWGQASMWADTHSSAPRTNRRGNPNTFTLSADSGLSSPLGRIGQATSRSDSQGRSRSRYAGGDTGSRDCALPF